MDNQGMNIYKRHHFPPEIIQYAVWLYYRFNLSHRDIEDLLAERSIIVSYEAIRIWCRKFGAQYARRLKRNHQGYGDTFFIDEVFVKIQGKQHYLWRAVDQDGEVVDVFLQPRRDAKAAKRFFKRLFKRHDAEPRKIVTDKLCSYSVAHRELIPDTLNDTRQYANNRAELSHQPTRVRERGNAEVQIGRAGTRFPLSSCRGIQSIQLGASFSIGQELSIFQAARLCVLGKGSDNLRGKGNEFISTWEVNLSIPFLEIRG
jgi:putative transposase